jgi:glutathione S-transferase
VEHIFHVALAEDWTAALAAGEYRVSTRGMTLDEVGFIHCSQRHQVAEVSDAFYRGAGPLVLLTIDPARAGSPVREEAVSESESFPHLYGPLPLQAVVSVEPLKLR